jgi:DNA polymerase-3 subunit alpha
MLDSTARISDIISRAVELNIPAIGLTDHGNLFGAYEFYTECVTQGIKPIVGMEAYISPGEADERGSIEWGILEDKVRPGAYTHVTILAQTDLGLRNLYRIHRESFVSGFYRKPRSSRSLLTQYSEGLIVLSGCMGGELATRIRLGHTSQAREYAASMKEVFGERFFIEVMDHGIGIEAELNRELVALGKSLGIHIVATNDSHYVHPEDAPIHDAFICISTYAKISDEKRYRFNGNGYHLRSRREMDQLTLPPEAITNTLRVAEMVEGYGNLFERKLRMPTAIILEGWEDDDHSGPVLEEARI